MTTRDELADRLESISADLDELMFDALRAAMAAARDSGDGDSGDRDSGDGDAGDGAAAGVRSFGRRPADDKTLLAARRAIDKAVNLLRGR